MFAHHMSQVRTPFDTMPTADRDRLDPEEQALSLSPSVHDPAERGAEAFDANQTHAFIVVRSHMDAQDGNACCTQQCRAGYNPSVLLAPAEDVVMRSCCGTLGVRVHDPVTIYRPYTTASLSFATRAPSGHRLWLQKQLRTTFLIWQPYHCTL